VTLTKVAYYVNDDSSRPHTVDQWIATVVVGIVIIVVLALLDRK
jgi:hypothetical protein